MASCGKSCVSCGDTFIIILPGGPPMAHAEGVKYMAHADPPHDTCGCAKKRPRCRQNGSKKVVFWPKIRLSIRIRRNFQKISNIFHVPSRFLKKSVQKKGQKRVKIGVFGFLPYFTLFYRIFPILPYFGPDLGVRRLNLRLRAKPRGLKAARRWDGD